MKSRADRLTTYRDEYKQIEQIAWAADHPVQYLLLKLQYAFQDLEEAEKKAACQRCISINIKNVIHSEKDADFHADHMIKRLRALGVVR